MKHYKQVPFTYELAMKIQKGEIKGNILNKAGMPVQVLEQRLSCGNIIAIYMDPCDDMAETVGDFYPDGKYYQVDNSGRDILIYLEEKTPKHEFKPFDRVLVRDCKDENWAVNIFGYNTDGEKGLYYCIGNGCWRYCIPYEGNEHLVGTPDKPEEK